MKDKNAQASKGCITSYTACIQYDGPDLPCLGVTNGMMINQVMAVIIKKVCEIAQPSDLSSLSIQCLIERFNVQVPLSKNIVSYLQLIINNNCTLADLIDAINERIDKLGVSNLQLDIKCLDLKDKFGNVVVDEQSVLQALINETCSQKIQLSTLSGQLLNLQTTVNNLNLYNEPLLTSCVYTNKPTSVALQLLASNYCTYKVKVGSSDQIDTALSRQCDNLNARFVSNTNFIQAPASLADTNNNQWITICDLMARVQALEACACKVKCEDIKIGFEVDLNADKSGIILHYTSVAGTFIPSGFVDITSTLTIKDEFGHERVYNNMVVAQNGFSPDIDITPFNTTKPLDLCLQVTMSSTQSGITCVKCECRSYYLSDTGCPVCKVCIGSGHTSGEVTIVYSYPT